MALERLDPWLERRLAPVSRRLEHVDPNHITWISAAVGLAASVGLIRTPAGSPFLVVAAGAVIASYLLDVLDGSVARMHQRTSAYGDFLDHVLDRIVDTALVLALGLNPTLADDPPLALSAALAMVLGSYMGTQTKSSGLSRDYGGFSRADRLAVIALAAMLCTGSAPMPVSVAQGALWVVGLGGVYTFVVRGLRARRALTALDRDDQ